MRRLKNLSNPNVQATQAPHGLSSIQKKIESLNTALDSEKPNDAIHEEKYQKQSFDHLIDSVAVNISEWKNLPVKKFFSKVDLI